MFSNAYDHGVVTALDELEKFAGEKFAGKVGDAVGKAKKAVTDFYSPSAIREKNYKNLAGNREKFDKIHAKGMASGPSGGGLGDKAIDKHLSRRTAIEVGAKGGGTAAIAGGAGYGGYKAMSDDKKGRSKKAEWDKEAGGVGEFFGGVGNKLKQGAGAVQDFYTPSAIAAGRRPGAENALREGLEAQHPKNFGRDMRQRFTGHDPVGQGMAAGAGKMEEDLMSGAKRTALLRGLLTAGGAGAAGGGAYAASEYGSDD